MKPFLLLLVMVSSLTACGPNYCAELTKTCDACANTHVASLCRTVASAEQQNACRIASEQNMYASSAPQCRADGSIAPASQAPVADAACAFGKSQILSQPCCTKWGIDACGAGLFCAAFDGRTQDTCYADRSRADLSECDADTQCQSGSCHLQAKRCKSAPQQACERSVGCAPFGDMQQVCDWRASKPTCQTVLPQSEASKVCTQNADCADDLCADDYCAIAMGGACKHNEDCVAGSCHLDQCLAQCGGAWRPDCPGTPATPTAPTQLTCKAADGGIKLQWLDKSGNEDGYELWRTTSGQYTLVFTSAPDEESYLDVSAASGIVSSYYVRAFNVFGTSAKSNTCSVTRP